MAKYNLTPVEVPRISTKYRTIKTKLPVPESLKIFEILVSIGTSINDGSASYHMG